MNYVALFVLFAGIVAANAVPVDVDGLVHHRSRRDLTYPGDCESAKLQNFASKCGLTVTSGAKHYIVKHGSVSVTTIPRSVKDNGTCRSIINELNRTCPNGKTAAPPPPPPPPTTTKKPTTKKPKKG